MPVVAPGTILLIVAVAVLVGLAFAIVAAIVRYVAETALLSGVDEMESTGDKLTVRRGFRLGWSRQAWRLFVVDFVIYVPVAIGSLVLLAVAALPFLVWLSHVTVLEVIGSLVGVALVLLVILALVVLALLLSLVMPYVRRLVVLEKLGVRAAVRRGVALVRATLLDTGLMWLILAGLRILWSIVMIPVLILAVVIAAFVGGVPAGLIYLASHTWVVPAIVGGLLFVVVLIPLVTFVAGLFEAYTSTAWTLTYREVNSRPAAQPAAVEPAAALGA
jgi:hypothetical protein